MGWKHQAVFPSGKSYGPTLTQHLKVSKVYPARGGQRFAVVCPAVLTLNETCTCAPSPRGVDQVGAGCRIQQELHPPEKSTWDPLSFYLQLRCLFNRGYTPMTPSTSLNKMNLLQNGSGIWFLPAWHTHSGPFMMTFCIATAGPLSHLTFSQQLAGTCAQSVKMGWCASSAKAKSLAACFNCVTDGASSNSERDEREVQQEWRNRLDKRQQQKATIRFQTIKPMKMASRLLLLMCSSMEA